MRFIKTTLAAAGVALVVSPGASSAQTKCGTTDEITIANMTWLSAQMLAEITKIILVKGYGCKAKLVPGNTVPTATTMLTKNRPDIAPELWISTAAAIWKKMADKGNVYKAGNVFSNGGKEGWWIPSYVAKKYPKLKSITDLKKYPHLFKEAATGGKGRLYACPPGWACEIINGNLFMALGMKKANWVLFSPGSGANLRKQPIVAYYWGPTAVVGKYKLVRLAMPKHEPAKWKCLTDKNCENPKATGWKPGEVAVAVVKKLKAKAPNVAAFLGKLQVTNASVNEALAWADDEKASGRDVAIWYLKKNPAIWTKWVPADVAARVKASLK
jgi:glycine betaine/proline transport system substrate-binding protein